MKRFPGWMVLVGVLGIWLGTGLPAVAAGGHLLTQGQARQLARLVARHEHINLKSEWIEFDSMDVGAPYLPGFASFTVVREARTPGPDTTLRRYAVNRRTGNVWEMLLCRKYDFPALARLRKKLTGRAEASGAEVAAERRELGCDGHGGTARPAKRAFGAKNLRP